MKLHKIRFRDINCLAGEWEVDFEAEGLKDGLFVLSGPTGAGKSSLLDAVTLALYGRTARQGRITDGANEVMNRGSLECRAEAEFTGVDGRRYAARWSQRRKGRKKDGTKEFYTPEFALVDLETGEDISPHKGKDAKALAAEKIGYGFEDFIRTVVLEQGRFDEFLHAKEADRAGILEKATDTGHFSAFGARVNARKREERAKADEAGVRHRALAEALKGRRDAAELRAEAEAADAAAAAAGRDEERLRKELEWLGEEGAIASGEAEWAAEAAALEAGREEAAGARARLETADRARELRVERERAAAARREAEEEAKRAEERAAAAAAAAARVPEAERCAAAAKERLARGKAEEEKARPGLAEAKKLDAAAGAARAAEDTARAARERLSEATAAAVRRLEEARGKLEAARQETAAAVEGVAAAGKEEEAAAGKRAAAAEASERKERAERAWTEADARWTEDRKPELEAMGRSLREKQVLAERVWSCREWRGQLRDGEACPVCGATVHPYADGTALPEDVSGEIAALEAKLKREENEVRQLARAAAAARKEWETADAAADAAEERARASAGAAVARLRAAEAAVRTLEEGLPGASEAVEQARAREEAGNRDVAEKARARADAEAARAALGVGDAAAEEARLRGAVEAASAESAEAEKRLEGSRTERRNAEEEAARAREAAVAEKRACAAAEAAFAARLSAAGFAGVAEWTAACLEESGYRRLAKACEDFRAEEERLRGRRELLDARKAAHAGAEGRPAEGRAEDAVRADLAGASEARRAAEAEAVKARKEIEDQADERRRCAAAEAAWKTREARAKKWEWLDRRVGGENGANFRRYAQGRNLRVLLDAATPRLEAMSGGDYRFEWDAGSDSLEPLVRDRHYEKARPVSNLSGGESFFASLALALSFANFNARQAPIGTLFLDEGFGTLDAVSLDRALDVLAGLGAESGRQVGLVTHVEQVKERVAVHIDVEKRGDGRSVLRGPGVRRLSAEGAGKGMKAKGDGG